VFSNPVIAGIMEGIRSEYNILQEVSVPRRRTRSHSPQEEYGLVQAFLGHLYIFRCFCDIFGGFWCNIFTLAPLHIFMTLFLVYRFLILR